MSKAVLEFHDVTFQYKEEKKERAVPILDSLSLRIADGELISIVGPSGSGKSTLFRLITGLEQPVSGEIRLDGEVCHRRSGRVGYMPQHDLLMPWRSIVENAVLPLELKGVKKAEAHKQVRGLLEEFGLKGVEQRYPGDLSGGMRQRVSFLRTVLSGSNVLLLDEPFSALDAITKLSMQEWLLGQWEKRKKTILFITHDVNEALFLSDRIFILTNTPVQMLEEVKVPLNRPRSLRDLNHPAILQLKDELIDRLRGKVNI
jgi:putative hydroxymethylpyrimidine transport system ATP-binding protein